jgi:hypothetical protein
MVFVECARAIRSDVVNCAYDGGRGHHVTEICPRCGSLVGNCQKVFRLRGARYQYGCDPFGVSLSRMMRYPLIRYRP